MSCCPCPTFTHNAAVVRIPEREVNFVDQTAPFIRVLSKGIESPQDLNRSFDFDVAQQDRSQLVPPYCLTPLGWKIIRVSECRAI